MDIDTQPDTDRLSVGNGGWIRHTRTSSPVVAYFRMVEHEGRLAVAEEYLHRADGSPLSAADRRGVPRQRVTSWANAEADRIRSRTDFPGPDLRTAAAWFSGSSNEDHWPARMLRSQIEGSGEPPGPVPGRRAGISRRPPSEVSARLDIPAGRPYGDAFYWDLLRLRDVLVAAGVTASARVIADANEVNYATVRSWLATASNMRRTGEKRPRRFS